MLVLVTGGSSGIGKAAALELAKNGAELILQARNTEKLKSVAQEIASFGGKVHYYSTDLTKPEEVERMAIQIIDEVGLPDVVINSAGSGEWLSLKEASLSHYATTMDSPYLATAYTCKVFYDKMLERGSGKFIIINSAGCYFSFASATGYTAARWALLGFTKSLQADLFQTNIKVSMIAFGKVDSPYFANNPISEDRIPRLVGWLIPTISTSYCGRVISNSIKSNKKIVIKPVILSLFVWFNCLFPNFFIWLIRITTKNLDQQN